jgi:alpha-glucuronidase
MRRSPLLRLLLLAALLLPTTASALKAEDGYELWLRYHTLTDAARLREYRAALTQIVVPGNSATLRAARSELARGLSGLLGAQVPVADAPTRAGALIVGTPASSKLIASLPLAADLQRAGTVGYVIRALQVNGRPAIVVAANRDIGALYGSFALLRRLQTLGPLSGLSLVSAPKVEYRMLDHWDNLNGSIERGYAGRSLWEWSKLPDTLSARYVDYARANASIGINAVSLTNVNANAQVLTPEYLAKVAALANVFRPYGIKVFLTARYSAPIEIGGLKTADPLDAGVRAWWKQKADEIYRYVPDFGGFLVKANSEGQPGPQDYHRNHADGANMLAEAVGPHGGVVIWRAFVYSSEVASDRVKQAYDEFKPLDGKFHDNVFIQVKNGPLDFQPREPFSPLFGAMPKTPIMMEFQITQEYLGQNSDLVYLAPMWKETLNADTYAKGPGSTVAKVIDGTLEGHELTGMAGVANTGNDRDWTGHPFAAANWYAFGRLAWDPFLSARGIAQEWAKMTWGNDPQVDSTVVAMMLTSREAAVDYMTPLGLHHQMARGHHYGPGPWVTGGRADQTSVYFNRADSLGIGFDRTPAGSDAVEQYFPPVRDRYASRATVPDSLLLWFHHVGWKEKMHSGRTLWDELLFRYQTGVDSVRWMQKEWSSLQGKIDPERFQDVRDRLATQEKMARWWRDASTLYFQTFSKMPIPASYEKPVHPLDFYMKYRAPRLPEGY